MLDHILHTVQEHGRSHTTVHSLETGTLTFCCLSHIVVDIVKTTVHPALCDPCNYSLPHLRPEKSKNREIEIQPGFTKLGQVCHSKMYGEADPKPRFLRFYSGFLILNSAQIRLSKASGPVSDEWTVHTLQEHGRSHPIQITRAWTSLIRSSFIRIPRHPEENRWLPIYSICHAYIQYVWLIIRFPRLPR